MRENILSFSLLAILFFITNLVGAPTLESLGDTGKLHIALLAGFSLVLGLLAEDAEDLLMSATFLLVPTLVASIVVGTPGYLVLGAAAMLVILVGDMTTALVDYLKNRLTDR